jgi:nitrate reductase NapD
MSDYNVCGVLVMARPDSALQVQAVLSAMQGVEVHANNNGKLVVTVEGPNNRDFANRIQGFSDIRGVLSTSLVYHEIETNDEAPAQSATHSAGMTQELRP